MTTTMMKPLFFAGLLVSVLSSSAAQAQTVMPLTTPHVEGNARTTAVVGASVGIDRFGPPAVMLVLAPTSAPLTQSSSSLLLSGRIDAGTRTVGVGVGGQFIQALGGVVFLREAVLVQPFVIAVDEAVGGVRGELTAQVGFHLGSVDIAVGPRFVPVLAVAESSDGRLGLELAGAARWFILDELALTAELSGGSDASHRDGVIAGSVLSGAAFVGVQWAPR